VARILVIAKIELCIDSHFVHFFMIAKKVKRIHRGGTAHIICVILLRRWKGTCTYQKTVVAGIILDRTDAPRRDVKGYFR
jgi:hypothetical protein